nr:hypothetical protein CFP56_44916 [Quercus suber]
MDFNYSHGLKPKSMQFFGNDVRFGFVPYDDNSVYWFFTWTPFSQGYQLPASQVLLSHLGISSPTFIADVLRCQTMSGL